MKRRWTAGALVVSLIGVVAFVSSLDGALHPRQPSQVLLDRRGLFLGEVPGTGGAHGFWPLPATLPEKVLVTTLETEDRRFFEHAGISWSSVARALQQNVSNRRVISGASTIAMQVARLEHPKARTFVAKAREAGEALLLIHRHGHDAVLRQYLTIAPYGPRTHGIVRASSLYFDKPIDDLSWLQAAYLAALPQQPSRMSPFTDQGHARAMDRARRILRSLHERGVLTDDELRVSLVADLALSKHPKRPIEALHVVLALQKHLPAGRTVHRTTIDLDVQRRTQQAVAKQLSTLRSAGAGNSAAVVLELPSGDVLAYVGSAEYFDAENRGGIDYLQARRSPGSSLKPFIYAMALERGTHTAATELPDTPVEFPTANGGVYVPENMTHTFMGPLLLRQALANSRNIPALRVLSNLGVDQVLHRLERGGIKQVSYDPNAYGLTLAMGSLHVTPLELAGLYAALANGGRTVPLRRFIDEPTAASTHLFDEHAAQLTAHMLADADARRPGFPAGGPMDFETAVAVKTGTSQGYRDAWATGFSDRLLVTAWVGNHDWRRMNGVSGATAAAPIVHELIEQVGAEVRPWQPLALSMPLPNDAVAVDVCPLSGQLPGPTCTHVKTEHFMRGTEPTAPCPFHTSVRIDSRTALLAGPSCPSEFVVTKSMLALPETYADWARRQRLAIAPTVESPLCPRADPLVRSVRIREPRPAARFLFDPDTPPELSTVRLSASVQPATAEVVWLVDGTPLARVGYPHEARLTLTPGRHVIRAVLAGGFESSESVGITVDD